MVEELSKKISFRLAKKLEKREISIEEMVDTIGIFLRLISSKKDIEEIKKFVNNV